MAFEHSWTKCRIQYAKDSADCAAADGDLNRIYDLEAVVSCWLQGLLVTVQACGSQERFLHGMKIRLMFSSSVLKGSFSPLAVHEVAHLAKEKESQDAATPLFSSKRRLQDEIALECTSRAMASESCKSSKPQL